MKVRSTRLNQNLEFGFALIELLVVAAIIGILLVLVVPALLPRKTANDITKAGADMLGLIEQAQSYAMANNTYVWAGFFEENSDSPTTAGIGRVVVSVVASRNGTRAYSDTVNDPPPLNPALLVQISKLFKLENAHLERVADGAIARANIPPNQYHVGHADFAKRVQFDGSSIPNNTTFSYPLTGEVQYTFTKIVQFNPQGDASKIVDTIARTIEIGLRPTHGPAVDNNTQNLLAVQISGIAGHTRMYRP